jgi:hypothetical protein
MQIGSLVECIEDLQKYATKGETTPIKGNIYTVREIFECDEYVAIRLEEIINTPQLYNCGFMECGFWIGKFRELQPPMDIEIDKLIEETILI